MILSNNMVLLIIATCKGFGGMHCSPRLMIGDKIMYVYDLDPPTPFRGSPISFPHGRAFAEMQSMFHWAQIIGKEKNLSLCPCRLEGVYPAK